MKESYFLLYGLNIMTVMYDETQNYAIVSLLFYNPGKESISESTLREILTDLQ